MVGHYILASSGFSGSNLFSSVAQIYFSDFQCRSLVFFWLHIFFPWPLKLVSVVWSLEFFGLLKISQPLKKSRSSISVFELGGSFSGFQSSVHDEMVESDFSRFLVYLPDWWIFDSMKFCVGCNSLMRNFCRIYDKINQMTFPLQTQF